MKRLVLICLFAVTACAVGNDYHPKLLTAPIDTKQYDSDRLFCIKDADQRMKSAEAAHEDDKLMPALGLIGYAIGKSNADPNDAYWKTPATLVDECMTLKGYKVVSQ